MAPDSAWSSRLNLSEGLWQGTGRIMVHTVDMTMGRGVSPDISAWIGVNTGRHVSRLAAYPWQAT